MGWLQRVRALVVAAALLSPLFVHAAAALGRGYGVAIGAAALQAVAVGAGLWPVLPWKGGALLLTAALLAALAWGGPMASAGLTHAALYAGLLAVFGASLRPGRSALVTRLAARINPQFHAGMVPYTRKVTAAWCLFFAGQVLASAGLLLAGRIDAWILLVSSLHLPLVAAFALGELAVRRWRWRHEHSTGLLDTIRGVRQGLR